MRRIEIQYTSLCNTVLKKPLVLYVVNTNSQCFHKIYIKNVKVMDFL